MNVSNKLKKTYDEQYNDTLKPWRELSAKDKVQNIVELTSGHKFEKVLEVGSGDGSILLWLDRICFSQQMYSLEISSSGIEQIKKRDLSSLVEVKLFNGYEIPYPDDFFDLVICSHVIEHVEFPRLLLREIKRISRMQVFEIPIDFSLNVDKKVNHFLSYGHINIYTPFLFRFLLKSEDFEIIRDKCGFYTIENLRYQYKRNRRKLMVFRVKKLIYGIIPRLKDIKPQVYTVFTS